MARATLTLAFPDPKFLFGIWWNTPPEQRNKEFWTPQQIAWKLGRHEAYVRRLAGEGKLPAIRVYGQIFIHIPSLLAAMKQTAMC